MANYPTDVYWEVDGVSLQTYASNITTWGGDRESVPYFRGDDITVPGRPGSIWMPRTPASRTLSLDMWVIGANSDGLIPNGTTSRRLFEDNWNALRRLFWNPNRQIEITKRFKVDGAVIVAKGKAQFTGGLNPSMNGNSRAVFSVDLYMSDPFFYGTEVQTNFTSALRTQTITVAGDYRTEAIRVVMPAGQAVNAPQVKNNTANSPNGVFVKYNRSIASADIAELDIQNRQAKFQLSAGAITYENGKITHTVGQPWLYLDPGGQQIAVTVTSGTGTVQLFHKPVWF